MDASNNGGVQVSLVSGEEEVQSNGNEAELLHQPLEWPKGLGTLNSKFSGSLN